MMMNLKKNILVVDDEKDITELVCYNLTKEGFSALCAENSQEAFNILNAELIDMIVLDLMLPGTDGLEFTKKLKNNPNFKNIPIIMLTAKDDESDIIIGLELGADDYITKPFSPKVLVARIKAGFRRRDGNQIQQESQEIKIYDLVIDVGKRKTFLLNNPIELTYTEFQILLIMAKRPGWVFTRSQLVDAVKGEDYHVTERSIDVQIAGLRKKLGEYEHYIETVRGVGYRLKDN